MKRRKFKCFGISIDGSGMSVGSFLLLAILALLATAALSFLLTWGFTWAIITLFALPVVATWKIALGVWLICIVIKNLIRGAINSSKLVDVLDD